MYGGLNEIILNYLALTTCRLVRDLMQVLHNTHWNFSHECNYPPQLQGLTYDPHKSHCTHSGEQIMWMPQDEGACH